MRTGRLCPVEPTSVWSAQAREDLPPNGFQNVSKSSASWAYLSHWRNPNGKNPKVAIEAWVCICPSSDPPAWTCGPLHNCGGCNWEAWCGHGCGHVMAFVHIVLFFSDAVGMVHSAAFGFESAKSGVVDQAWPNLWILFCHAKWLKIADLKAVGFIRSTGDVKAFEGPTAIFLRLESCFMIRGGVKSNIIDLKMIYHWPWDKGKMLETKKKLPVVSVVGPSIFFWISLLVQQAAYWKKKKKTADPTISCRVDGGTPRFRHFLESYPLLSAEPQSLDALTRRYSSRVGWGSLRDRLEPKNLRN